MIKVAIHSVPRSGSSWLGSIFDSSPHLLYRYQPLFSYAHKDRLNLKSSKEDIDQFFKEIADSEDPLVMQEKSVSLGIVPRFPKSNITHICYKEVRYHHLLKNILAKDDKILIVGLIRNPFAVINSWLTAPKEFRPELGWKISEEWRFAPRKNDGKPEEFNGYEKWKEVTLLFLELRAKYPQQFKLVEYERLLDNTVEEVEKIFSFAQLEVTDQTLSFLHNSKLNHHEDPYSVFKSRSRDDQWASQLPKYIINEIKADKEFMSLNSIFKWQ